MALVKNKEDEATFISIFNEFLLSFKLCILLCQMYTHTNASICKFHNMRAHYYGAIGVEFHVIERLVVVIVVWQANSKA